MIEQWATVPGWDGFYEVSDQGQVRSLPRETFARGAVVRLKGKQLRASVNSDGYRTVNLYRGDGPVSVKVSRLVALAWLPPARLETVDHINRNRADDRAANLRWATKAENTRNASLRRDSALGIKGVRRVPSGNYAARIRVDGKRMTLGTFETEALASEAYLAAAVALHGAYASG